MTSAGAVHEQHPVSALPDLVGVPGHIDVSFHPPGCPVAEHEPLPIPLLLESDHLTPAVTLQIADERPNGGPVDIAG